jgi:hypothetical protein
MALTKGLTNGPKNRVCLLLVVLTAVQIRRPKACVQDFSVRMEMEMTMRRTRTWTLCPNDMSAC